MSLGIGRSDVERLHPRPVGGSRIEEEARRLGTNLWLTVSEFNERARAFYVRHGFEETARLSGLVADGTAELLLRKRLGGAA